MLSRAHVAVLTVSCFVLTAVVPLDAAAQADTKKDQARQFFEAGKRFYEMQAWKPAIEQFKQAAGLLPSPILDYNIGLCYEKLTKPKAAIKYYKRYLAGAPKADNKAEVEGKIAALEAQANQAPPLPPPVAAPPGAPPPPIEVAPETPEEGVPGAPPPPPPGGYYSYGQTTTASPAPPPYLPPPEQHRSVTSQWWFWMLMAVAAAVTIGIIYAAAHQSHSTYTTGYMGAGGGRVVLPGHSGHTIRGGLLDRPLLSYPAHAGATLFRF